MRAFRHPAPLLAVAALGCGARLPAPATDSKTTSSTRAATAEPAHLAAPRLLSPLTGYGVSTHKPTFRVEPAPGADGAEIEICRDRECRQPIAKFAGLGGRIRPAAPLPEGRFFYRARSRRHGRTEGPPSVAFQFAVRRGAPDVDTAFVSFNDANADGHDDEPLFGAKEGFVFRVSQEETGGAYARVGDVNGDGFSDVLGGVPCASDAGCPGAPALLFLGGANGFTKRQGLAMPAPEAANPDSGREFSDAGDVDGDGYADVVEFCAGGGTYLYRGGAEGFELPAVSLGETQSTAAVLGGDFNGDGYADLVLARAAGAPPYGARVYFGGPGGPGRGFGLRAPDDAADFGVSLVARGDVNGDGFSDVVIGASSAPYAAAAPRTRAAAGQVYVFYGARAPSPEAAVVLRGTESDGALFGLGLGVGDLNGNGAADVVAIAPCAQRATGGECRRGQAFVFEGSSAGIAAIPTGTLADTSTPSSQVVLIRDLDGDGFDDMSYAGVFYRGSLGGVDAASGAGVR
jgi:hypothetical protein